MEPLSDAVIKLYAALGPHELGSLFGITVSSDQLKQFGYRANTYPVGLTKHREFAKILKDNGYEIFGDFFDPRHNIAISLWFSRPPNNLPNPVATPHQNKPSRRLAKPKKSRAKTP